MAVTSPFYFDATASGKSFTRGIPMFAVSIGESLAQGWQSANIQDFAGYEALMDRVNVQVPVHLAMPRLFANATFQVGATFEKIAVSAFRPRNSTDYMSGSTITLVIKNVKVLSLTPILQWQGLPIPPQVQKNFLEKKIGRETYIPMAVKLWVYEAEAVQ